MEFTHSLSDPTDKLDRLGHPSPPFTMPQPILYMLCIITSYTIFVKLREILLSLPTEKKDSEILNLACVILHGQIKEVIHFKKMPGLHRITDMHQVRKYLDSTISRV